MNKSLDSKKWSHFKDKHFLENLIFNRENILIIGPPKAGKSELIRDLFDPNTAIRINCLIFDNIAKLTADFCEKIIKSRMSKNNKINSTFAHLILWLSSQKEETMTSNVMQNESKLLTVIFENAHTLLDIGYDNCSDFFKVYSRFIEEVNNIIDIQTIIISRSEIPVDYFKICIPYPNYSKLAEFVGQKFDERAEKMPADDLKPKILKMRQSFITTILEFEIIAHDFDSFDLLTEKIFSQVKRGLKESASTNSSSKNHQFVSQNDHSIKSINGLENLISVFFFNIKAIYYSNKELREMAINFSDKSVQNQSYTIFNSVSHTNKKMLESMPNVACYIILACYIASIIPQSKDHTVLGIVKGKSGGKKNSWLKNIKSKAFCITRAISIVEILMENSKERENINEHQLIYHSTEFYMIFDFLERIKWIKETGIGQIPKYYKFICDPGFISDLLSKLGLDRSEYFFHGN